ncbi:OB-fold protein [Sphingorhabdus sp. 109]|uniref:OB-fold protein n=1 Tax=Sphingorhabdus sp. 109 TaxID=2653173 RepID=UPI0012EF4A6C|nr:hypothetical protein [Sphingorhabdus sp. 109]VWX62518.1 exported hypothetical protein [Sphingorhabdus sp. 109]
MLRIKIDFVAILVLASVSACSEPAPVEMDWDTARLVTTDELEIAFEENEVAAQQNYGRQPLYVRGKISDILLNFENDPMLNFESDGLLPIQAVMPGQATDTARLAKGQSATLGCTDISEVLGTPMLKDCIVVEFQ